MTQGERVKEVRKSLGLTLEKFGEKLGVGKTAISNIEKGSRNLTEQMTKSICREYGVDYMWLTSGDGEMFVESDDDFFEKIDRIMAGENETRKNMFKALLYASDDDIEALARIIERFQMQKKTDSLFQLPVSWVYRYRTNLYILLRVLSLRIFPTNSMIVSL